LDTDTGTDTGDHRYQRPRINAR